MLVLIQSIICLSALMHGAYAATLKKVTIELKWFHQFQFAGIYAAKEKGFYRAEGLAVTIKERDIKSSPVKDVLSGAVQFGIADATIVKEKLKGKPVVLLAAIYQHSPLVLLSLKKNNILSPIDLRGKKIMYQKGVDEALVVAMLKEFGLTEEDYVFVPHNFKNMALVTDDIIAMSAYLGDQDFLYKQKGIAVNILKPQSYGVDFYGDMLFTSEAYFFNNKKTSLAMRRATISGWRYALDHPEEIIDIIISKYKTKKTKAELVHEYQVTKRMISAEIIKLGTLSQNRLTNIANIYKMNDAAITPEMKIDGLNYKDFLYDENDYRKIVIISIIVILCLSSLLFGLGYFNRRLKRLVSKRTDALEQALAEVKDKSERLSKQNTALEEARAMAEKKREELAKVNSYKSEFIANLSHELRTPLNSVILLSKLLLEDQKKNFDEDTLQSLKYIHQGGDTLLILVNDILDLAKIEAGKMQMNFEEVTISQIADETESAFAIPCRDKQIAFEVTIAPDVVRALTTDKVRLLQILRNFISNALKFTERGAIKLVIESVDADDIKFSVIDTGIGIQKDNLELIFSSFQQIDGRLNRKYTGTGLGLTICNNLAALLGGRITVDSTLHKGSSFSVILPRVPKEAQ